jgi:hypothetical protein
VRLAIQLKGWDRLEGWEGVASTAAASDRSLEEDANPKFTDDCCLVIIPDVDTLRSGNSSPADVAPDDIRSTVGGGSIAEVGVR